MYVKRGIVYVREKMGGCPNLNPSNVIVVMSHINAYAAGTLHLRASDKACLGERIKRAVFVPTKEDVKFAKCMASIPVQNRIKKAALPTTH